MRGFEPANFTFKLRDLIHWATTGRYGAIQHSALLILSQNRITPAGTRRTCQSRHRWLTLETKCVFTRHIYEVNWPLSICRHTMNPVDSRLLTFSVGSNTRDLIDCSTKRFTFNKSLPLNLSAAGRIICIQNVTSCWFLWAFHPNYIWFFTPMWPISGGSQFVWQQSGTWPREIKWFWNRTWTSNMIGWICTADDS